MRKTLLKAPGILLAGLLIPAIVSGAAHADIISGTFSGLAISENDPENTLGLGTVTAGSDVISGSFAFDSALVSSLAGGISTNNLTISIDDETAFTSQTYLDSSGSVYTVTDGLYQLISSGGGFSTNITLEDPSIFGSSGLNQSFTATASGGSVSYGDASMDFSITSAQITDVSEPASLSVLGLGLCGLIAVRRRGLKVSGPNFVAG